MKRFVSLFTSPVFYEVVWVPAEIYGKDLDEHAT
jgi:hypothetical protein